MSLHARKLVFILFSMGIVGQLSAADDKKPKDKKAEDNSETIEQVLNIDPTGRPSMDARDKTAIFVWRDDDGWHLRTNVANRAKKARRFGGQVFVVDGRVTSLSTIEGLEPKGKNKDKGWLSPEKKMITFEFGTSPKGEDGFDFKVSDTTTALRFDLRLQGYDHPERIVIGGKKQPAPSGKFTLPAQ